MTRKSQESGPSGGHLDTFICQYEYHTATADTADIHPGNKLLMHGGLLSKNIIGEFTTLNRILSLTISMKPLH